MNFKISQHAKEEIQQRNIPLNLLDSVLNNPQQIVSEKNNRKAYQSKVEFEAGKTFHLNKTAVIKITSLVNQGFHDID
ncbi:MAG TPA: DUF4258 domain-containing protein [Thiotrichaceae bacterium]|nr:DUF4258 domain-containing protein [Thiotrichaceae bacterium]